MTGLEALHFSFGGVPDSFLNACSFKLYLLLKIQLTYLEA
jgi:hypothetical protein